MALVPPAMAQVVPPPPIATVVNFDDIVGAPTSAFDPIPPLPPDMYAALGVTIAGFGTNGGAVFDFSNTPSPALSPPNVMAFASIAHNTAGGLVQSPETFTFFPPIVSLQFDISLANLLDCMGTEVVKVEAFAPGGAPLSTQTVVPPDGNDAGLTVSLTFPPTGAEKVVLSSISICQNLLEAFWIDNIAFVPIATAASKCAQASLDAAGKKAKAVTACYAKAVEKGVEVDAACLQKASDAFAKAFAKAQGMGGCPTDVDEPTTEGAVDTFGANVLQAITGGAPGPDICDSKKLTAAGKKAQDLVSCFSKAAKSGAAVDPACGSKAAQKFTSSLKKCGTVGQLAPVESVIDAFVAALNRSLTVPTTTTTTTTTSTTTTTTAPPLGQHLSFTTTVGTANCGGPGLMNPLPDPPFSGELDSDAAGTMKIADLGLGCLYIGGGGGTIPASVIPENATSILNSPDGMTLEASFGTGPRDCSRGPEATRHCVNDPTVSCTSDADCGGAASACAPDANCFFGPPVPVNGFPPSCVVNAFAADASGTLDLATGASSVNITLSSRVYLTLNQPSTCPQCMAGACNYGANAGGACTTDNSALTSLDCLPNGGLFVAVLPIDLSPLTTGSISDSAADGLFCPGQDGAGAFGVAAAQAIKQTGSPAGDLSDGLSHPSVLVSNFCIPQTGNPALDTIADLPGPGSLSLSGDAQFFASPSGAFLTE